MSTTQHSVAAPMALRIGNRTAVQAIDSFAQAAQIVNAMRDKLERDGRGGNSRFPTIRIVALPTGQTIGHVSYNGRMWEGEPTAWTPATREIR